MGRGIVSVKQGAINLIGSMVCCKTETDLPEGRHGGADLGLLQQLRRHGELRKVRHCQQRAAQVRPSREPPVHQADIHPQTQFIFLGL